MSTTRASVSVSMLSQRAGAQVTEDWDVPCVCVAWPTIKQWRRRRRSQRSVNITTWEDPYRGVPLPLRRYSVTGTLPAIGSRDPISRPSSIVLAFLAWSRLLHAIAPAQPNRFSFLSFCPRQRGILLAMYSQIWTVQVWCMGSCAWKFKSGYTVRRRR